jgi:hypothetical protein
MKYEAEMMGEKDFIKTYSRDFMKRKFEVANNRELALVMKTIKHLDDESHIEKSKVRLEMAMEEIRRLAIEKAITELRKEQEMICILMGTCPNLRQSFLAIKGMLRAKENTGSVYDLDIYYHNDNLTVTKV